MQRCVHRTDGRLSLSQHGRDADRVPQVRSKQRHGAPHHPPPTTTSPRMARQLDRCALSFTDPVGRAVLGAVARTIVAGGRNVVYPLPSRTRQPREFRHCWRRRRRRRHGDCGVIPIRVGIPQRLPVWRLAPFVDGFAKEEVVGHELPRRVPEREGRALPAAAKPQVLAVGRGDCAERT